MFKGINALINKCKTLFNAPANTQVIYDSGFFQLTLGVNIEFLVVIESVISPDFQSKKQVLII
jgi:hypothetical protein